MSRFRRDRDNGEFLRNVLEISRFYCLKCEEKLGPYTSANDCGSLPSNMFHGYDVCGVGICAIRYPEGTSGVGSIKYSRCPKVILIDQQFRKLSTYRVQIRWRLRPVQLPTDERSTTIKTAMCASASVVSSCKNFRITSMEHHVEFTPPDILPR